MSGLSAGILSGYVLEACSVCTLYHTQELGMSDRAVG